MNRKILLALIIGILFAICVYFLFVKNEIKYANKQYGFSISLPQDWKGYSIIANAWEGDVIGQKANVPAEHGPLISIRNSKWTESNPYQDIPIMIFTLDQWNLLQQEKFHIGAAPIGPSEIGRNLKYVFALPARYNYAFPIGYQEVEQIIQSKSFKAF